MSISLLLLWVLIFIFSSRFVTFTVPSKLHSATSGEVIKSMRLSIHPPYVSVDMNNWNAAKPSISHDTVDDISLVAAFGFRMWLSLKDAFSKRNKFQPSAAIDKTTEVIGYWQASSGVTAFEIMMSNTSQSSLRTSSALGLLFSLSVLKVLYCYIPDPILETY